MKILQHIKYTLAAGFYAAMLIVVPLMSAGRSSAQGYSPLIATYLSSATIGGTVKVVDVTYEKVSALPNYAANKQPPLSFSVPLENTDGTKNGEVFIDLYGDKIIISCNDGTQASDYAYSNSSYTGLDVTVTDKRTGVYSCGFTYPFNSTTGANKISVDMSTAGQIDILFTDGPTQTNKALGSILTPGLVKFNAGRVYAYARYGAPTDLCTSLAALEYKTTVLFDSTASVLTLTKDAGICANFDNSTYNATTKAATIKHLAGNTPGITINHTIDTGYVYSATEPQYSIIKSLELEKYANINYFKDYILPTANASQQIYVGASHPTGGSYGKDVPYLLADGVADLSKADINFKTLAITFGSDKSTFKAFAHNLNKATKDGSYTLYVPAKDGDNFVGICNGVSSLDAITNKCSGVYYLKDGQSKTIKDTKSIPDGKTVAASKTSFNGVNYWKITGLTGTGGFSTSLASDPDTGYTPAKLTNTTLIYAAVFGSISLAVASRVLTRKRR